MESNVLQKRWVQGGNVVVDDLRGTAFTGEAGAHTFQISGVDSAQETVAITGTITGRFLTATNVTVPLTGSVSDGVASLTLTEDCYVVPGRFVLSVYATNGSTTQCIYCAVGNVFRTQSDIIQYPSASIPDIEQIIADAQAAVTEINADVAAAQAAVAAAQTAVDGIEAQRQTMIESIASVAGQGTDTTLSQSGVAADAKAAGDQISDLKSALTIISEPAPNLYNVDNVAIGKNWAGGTAADRATISIPVTGGNTYTVVIPQNANIPDVAVIRVNAYNSSLGSQYINGGNSAAITMESNCVEIRIQFQGSTTLTTTDFENYNVRVYEGTIDVSTALDSVARQDTAEITERVDGISEDVKNLCADETIEVGKDWTCGTNTKRAIMFVNVLPNTEYTIIIPENSYIDQVNAIQKTTRGANSSLGSTGLIVGENTLTTVGTAFCLVIQFANFTTDFTADMFVGYVPVVIAGVHVETARDDVARSVNHWAGKKMVWLGTSIPAAGRYQVNNPISYPIMIGNMLGATVYNEAVGSSALHCKDPARISTANPYGFFSNFEAVSRCLTNSLTEMNWIIEHYNDSAVFTQNVPASLSDADKAFIRSCSWENKIGKYLTESDFPDVWVIDHGHNDAPTDASEALYTAKSPINGTQHDGYYSNGNFVPSTASTYLEYDVSGLFKVWISGTFGTYYDIYDLYDTNGNNIGKRQNGGTETTVENFELDVMGASTLRVSNPNNKINTITVNELTYPVYENLYCYQGALDFIVNKILTYNPKARILMIGEYENQKFPKVSENQEIAAQRWEFPLYKQWEKLGWSQQPILVNGEWKRMLNIIIPDNLHPHTDTTGFALELMARNISGWLLTLG